MTESLCSTPETNTTIKINYTLIKMKTKHIVLDTMIEMPRLGFPEVAFQDLLTLDSKNCKIPNQDLQ